MSTILEQTEQRMAAATDSAKVLQQTRKQQIQHEIGNDTFTAAKEALPVMETFIQGTVVPWRNKIESIAQAGARLAPPRQLGVTVFMALRELDSMLGIPACLQRGIQAFETFTVPLWPVDTRYEDAARRIVLINGIRQDLRCHENSRPRMETLIGLVESWMKESGWTHAQESEAVA